MNSDFWMNSGFWMNSNFRMNSDFRMNIDFQMISDFWMNIALRINKLFQMNSNFVWTVFCVLFFVLKHTVLKIRFLNINSVMVKLNLFLSWTLFCFELDVTLKSFVFRLRQMFEIVLDVKRIWLTSCLTWILDRDCIVDHELLLDHELLIW